MTRGLLAVALVGACGGAPRPLPHGPTSDLAIADAMPTPDGGVLARTDDGGIVLLDAQLRVTWRYRPASRVTGIAVDATDEYVAHADGTIETLGHPAQHRPQRTITRIDGAVLWFSVQGSNLMAFTIGSRRELALRIDVGTDHERAIDVPRE